MRHAVTARIGREGHAVRVRHWETPASHCRIALVKKLNSPKRRAATSAVSVRGGCAAGSISDFAEPVELLFLPGSCAGSCTCTCAGSCTCAPHLTPLCARCAPHLTPLVPC